MTRDSDGSPKGGAVSAPFTTARAGTASPVPSNQSSSDVVEIAKGVESLKGRIADVLEEDGGCWQACSGCQESSDGCVSTKDYPYSDLFKCQPGGGCRECGGIGVLWTDGAFLSGYADLANETPNPSPASNGDYVVVPREPTEAMLTAGIGEWLGHGTKALTLQWRGYVRSTWCAMLAAAPASSAPIAEGLLAGLATVPADVAARQLMGLYYELSGNPDMAAAVRSENWQEGSGFGSGSERALLGVMAAMVEAVRKEFVSLNLPSDAVSQSQMVGSQEMVECHGLDTTDRVCFYEQDFYVLSNFSSFTLYWNAAEKMRFDTSEAAYHWEKFPDNDDIRFEIINAPSAHEAFKIAERNKQFRRPDWDDVKVDVMRQIIRAKAEQHEYVYRKLLATGDRELVENSWRDDFWGWGPNGDGQNMLGKLWMELRASLRVNEVGN